MGRVLAGLPVAHVAQELGWFRPTAYRWEHRYRAEEVNGRQDRCSRPRTSPAKTSTETGQTVLAAHAVTSRIATHPCSCRGAGSGSVPDPGLAPLPAWRDPVTG
ncbi:leucine zipper domain-containing protein [Arthrobacter sedimenti]|uniref:leucine zipper domain-containing protein n=1 Tax=Arthrobacter sedimenti TaxID=2694931 RepID=UPI001CDBD08C